MIRVRLFGELDTLVMDEGIIERLEHLFMDHPVDNEHDAAPWRRFRPSVHAQDIEMAVPGLVKAVIIEQSALNALGLPANEVVIWGKNKVRAHPGPRYVDKRPPDEFTEF